MTKEQKELIERIRALPDGDDIYSCPETEWLELGAKGLCGADELKSFIDLIPEPRESTLSEKEGDTGAGYEWPHPPRPYVPTYGEKE